MLQTEGMVPGPFNAALLQWYANVSLLCISARFSCSSSEGGSENRKPKTGSLLQCRTCLHAPSPDRPQPLARRMSSQSYRGEGISSQWLA